VVWCIFFFFSSRRRHTRFSRDWSSDVCSSDLADGVRVTVETCPHYLTFCAEEIPDGATQFKCCPPIREAGNRELLWRGLAEGTRSEERRVGKEGRSRGSTNGRKKHKSERR